MSGKEKGSAHKTNALRQLEAMGVPCTIYTYDAPDGFLDGISVAHATGLPPERVFKTLVAQGASRAYIVFVIPVAAELDLKKAASAAGEKSVAMIPAREITAVTGYIKGGCSPVGMKKRFPTFIDESAALYGKIAVSAGRVGLQMELPAGDLRAATGGALADLTVG